MKLPARSGWRPHRAVLRDGVRKAATSSRAAWPAIRRADDLPTSASPTSPRRRRCLPRRSAAWTPGAPITRRRPASTAARAHQPLAWRALRLGHRAAAHRRHRRRVGGAAACLPGAVEHGDEVLMPDPSYPCNRHFVTAADGVPVLLPATAEERFQLSAAGSRRRRMPRAACCSPRRPTRPGPPSRRTKWPYRAGRAVRAGRFTLVDEIYLALSLRRRLRPERARPRRRRDLDQQLLQVFLHDRLAPGLAGAARGAGAGGREAGAEPLHLPVEPGAAGGAGLLRARVGDRRDERRRQEFRARRDFVPALEAPWPARAGRPDGPFYAQPTARRTRRAAGTSAST